MSREGVPFAIWSTGADGTRFLCVQHYRLAIRRASRGLQTYPRFCWSMQIWADRHAMTFDHEIVDVLEAHDLALRWMREDGHAEEDARRAVGDTRTGSGAGDVPAM